MVHRSPPASHIRCANDNGIHAKKAVKQNRLVFGPIGGEFILSNAFPLDPFMVEKQYGKNIRVYVEVLALWRRFFPRGNSFPSPFSSFHFYLSLRLVKRKDVSLRQKVSVKS